MATIKTKNGTIIRGIPDDIDKFGPEVQAFAASINQQGPGEYNYGNPAPIQLQTAAAQALNQQSQVPEPQAQTFGQKAMGQISDIAAGGTRGAGPVAAGALVGGAIGGPPGALVGAAATGIGIPVTDTIITSINGIFGTEHRTATEALNDLFTKIGVPEPETAAGRVFESVSRGASEAASGIGLGKTLAKSGSQLARGVGETLASGPAQQILGGAGAGAGQKIAEELGAGAGGQIAASLGGSILGGGLGGFKTTPAAATSAPIEEAAEAGVRIMTSDVIPPRNFMTRWTQQLQEKIPVFGTGKVRQMQQGERVAAVRNLIEEFGADDIVNVSDDIMDDLAMTHSKTLETFGKQKMKVIDALSDPNNPVPVNNAIGTIDEELTRLTSLNNPDVQPIINRLEGWKGSIQNQDLSNIESLRSIVGESYRGLDEGIRTTGQKSLNKVYTSLRKDMSEYIETTGGPDAINDFEGAMSALRDMSVDMKSTAFKRALNSGDVTPEMVDRLLFSKNQSEVRRLFNNLSEDGRASARTAILAKIGNNPSNYLPGSDEISPDKFLSAIKKLGDQTGVFFGPDDMKQLDGLTRVLDATKRAGSAAATPPTGVTLLPVAVTGGLSQIFGNGIEGALGALGVGAGIGGAGRIYESAPIRNILMKIPTVARGSAEEAKLFKRLLETAQTIEQKNEGVE